nr:piggyBac transposable element-derived protein 4-like [Leptinotarsa decemlineata]
MLNAIVKFTNQYIDSVKENYSRGRDALHTDIVEMKAFLGLLYIAGHYKGGRLNLEDFWDANGFGIEMFRMTMSLKRFRFLYQAIRFDNRETRAERKKYGRLAPIRDIFEQFVDNCKSFYSIGENVTLDEKLEAFRGRCSFIQYIPSKPAKYGIKIFALVDSKMYYTCNMEIYAGKQPEGPYQISNKSLDVVNRMIVAINNSGRNLTADNWFSDVSLLSTLADKRLSYVGTLKKNKWQIPMQLKDIKHREEYSTVFAYRKEETLVSYVPQNNSNKKNVLVISSMHFDGAIDEETGAKKKPKIITYYNKTKIGVDMVD